MRSRLRGWLQSGWVSHLLFYGTIGVALLLDQLTKAWVVVHLPEYQPVNMAEWHTPILSFTFVQNTGVAFGLFPGLGELFLVLSVLVVLGIVVFRRTLGAGDILLHGALGLVTGGALGNVVDRLARGYVVDFLDVNFWPLQAWPVFNLADSAIVVGVIVLFVDSLIVERDLVAADA